MKPLVDASPFLARMDRDFAHRMNLYPFLRAYQRQDIPLRTLPEGNLVRHAVATLVEIGAAQLSNLDYWTCRAALVECGDHVADDARLFPGSYAVYTVRVGVN